jgi:hypothetical protein
MADDFSARLNAIDTSGAAEAAPARDDFSARLHAIDTSRADPFEGDVERSYHPGAAAKADPYAGDIEASHPNPKGSQPDPYAGDIESAHPVGRRGSFYSEIPKMVTDIPHQTYENFKEGMRQVGQAYRAAPLGSGPNAEAAISAIGGVGKMIAAPFSGPAQSVIGHGMAAGLHAVGKGINAVTGADVTKEDTPEKLYGMGKEAVDTALMASGPGRGGVLGRVPTPPPEAPLAAKLLPAGSKPASDVEALRIANKRVAESFDRAGSSIVAPSPQDAAAAAQEQAQRSEKAAKTAVGLKYAQAEGLGAEVHPDVVRTVGNSVKTSLTDRPNPVTVDEGQPQASKALKYLDEQAANLNSFTEAANWCLSVRIVRRAIYSKCDGESHDGTNHSRKT